MSASTPNSENDLVALLPAVEQIVLRAGEKVMEIYRSDFDFRRKADRSPVTEADTAAEALITPVLQQLLPGVPVVGEEAASAAAADLPRVGDGPFWLVDPVDGTREFLKRNDEFTVNVALVRNRRAVLGVVLAPALDALYSGVVGEGAFLRHTGGDGGAATALQVRPVPDRGVTLVVSRSHDAVRNPRARVAGRSVAGVIACGSSLKICMIAAGKADIYPRPGPTCEWDTAAAHAVLDAAGGRVTLEDGVTPLCYAKRADFLNPGFIAWGGLAAS